jgi:hypothetical protein
MTINIKNNFVYLEHQIPIFPFKFSLTLVLNPKLLEKQLYIWNIKGQEKIQNFWSQTNLREINLIKHI